MKKVGLGFIGLGNQGKLHLRNCAFLKNVNIIGAADISEKALKFAKDMGVKNLYKDYENLLKRPDIDAVIISLPNFLHYEAVTKAAEYGKDIFVEKPLARSFEEGKKIISCLKKYGVRLMVGYNVRFNQTVRSIRDKIYDGFFGQVQIVEATNVSSGPFTPQTDGTIPKPVPTWWFKKELVGGGALLDLGCHMINTLTWWFGEVADVKCWLDYLFNMEVEDTAVCLLRFKNGPVGTVNVGWFSRDTMHSVKILGTSRNMHINLTPSNTFKLILRDVKRKFGLHEDSYYLEIKHFVESIQNDREPEPSAEEALHDLKIISMAYKKCTNINNHVK